MKRKIQILGGVVLGAGLLWVLFRNTKWGEVFDAIRKVSVGWLLLSLLWMVLSFFTRVQRWSYIVRTDKWVSFRHMFSATQIGFLANYTLPGRIGEVIRAALLARLGHLPFSKAVAMVALDRVTDLCGLVVVVVVVIFAYTPEGRVTIPKETFGHQITFPAELVSLGEKSAIAFLAVSVTALVLLYANQRLMLRISDACWGLVSRKLAARIHEFLQQFAEGLHVFRSGRDMAKSLFFSLVTWTLFILALVSLVQAFHIRGPWYTVFVMELLVAAAISVPGAPGFVGQFHVPIVVTLMMLVPGMDVSLAKAFAIVTHLLNVFPVLVVGIFCMAWENFGVGELTEKTVETMPERGTRNAECETSGAK